MNTQHVVNLGSELKPAGVGEELTVNGSVVSPVALPAKASHAEICVKGNPVRVTWDGTTPASAGAGAIMATGAREIWVKERVLAAKFVESTGSAAATVRIDPLQR